MTRKAYRKRLAATESLSRRYATAGPWSAAGLVATAALALGPSRAAAYDLDPRLAVVHNALRTRAAFQDTATGFQVPSTQATRFDIAPGPISTVVEAFQQATGFTVVLSSPSIGAIYSNGVSGLLTVDQALAALLEGTGVAFRFTASATVSLELRINAESVEVTGRTSTGVVSSPKYTTRLTEVPQTIEVIPQAVIEEQGATTLTEVLRNVPGISIQAGEGGGASSTSGDMFNMRGFNASNSLFVDGVRDDGLIARDVFNLEQVEVFLGPTGSDVGRGTAAGYVNMASKVPNLDPAVAVSYGYGTAALNRLTVDANQTLPMGEPGSWLGQTAVRFNAVWQEGGTPGRDTVEVARTGFAPSIALGVSTPTRAIVGVQVMRQDNLADYGVPAAAWTEPLTPTGVVSSRPVDQSNYYGSTSRYDYDDVQQETYTARIEHDLNTNLTLRNQTRYNNTHREAVISSPGAFTPATETVTILRHGNERENDILSNQTTAIGRFSTGRVPHAISAGLEFTSEGQVAPGMIGLGTRAPVSIYTPNPNDIVTDYAPTRSLALTDGQTDSQAAYVFDTMTLGNRWQLSGGVRVEHYDTSYLAISAAGVETTNTSADDTLVSGKAGLLYQLTPRGNVYVSWGTVLTPPGTANFTLSSQPNNQNNPNVDPQRSENFEVGSKWDLFGNRLTLSGAVFHTENENVIYTVDATAVPPIYNQDDGQIVKGVTLAAAGRITDRWQLLASMGYLNSRLVTQNPLSNGNELLLTPPFTMSVWTTYETALGLTFGGGIRHQDEVFVNAANTIRVPSHNIVDGLVEYAVNSHLSLRVNIYNLTNETYIRSINNNGARYNPGNPRAVTLSTQVGF
jgi:catecholate siderophore receptor